MKMLTRLMVCATMLLALFGTTVQAQNSGTDSALTALKTIDPEILQYFPRWRICEPDLQFQIKQTFALMGYPASNLDVKNITVTAAPQKATDAGNDFEIILIECGSESMVASEISSQMKKLGNRIADAKRPYCFQEVPPSEAPSSAQIAQIINLFEPTNVTHAFTLSAFEQSLKVGKSGFWLKSSIGTDQVGYQYWTSGEARIQLQRPLYENLDPETRKAIPYLINARLGYGYRLTNGLDANSGVLDFIPARKLNGTAGGKIVGGLEFNMPFHQQAGININAELPLSGISADRGIDATTYAQQAIGLRRFLSPTIDFDPQAIVPILRGTGQVTLFYNWWMDKKNPENFFRFDVGVSYAEVQETLLFRDTINNRSFITVDGVIGLATYKPNEFMDWMYAKIEYRNQNTFPFGASIQISNQTLLGRAYIPVLGDWLYIEGRYSTVLRTANYYEAKSFFMVSPVLRLNF